MTKAENRAAARAWRQERMRQRAEEVRAEAIAADLAELGGFATTSSSAEGTAARIARS
ncbi:hypothetical protein [Bradyrhizobium sp. JR18.2]|uniref:hypothetical protein n=1 Tax=Bradyrhizobium sp. JR18.2 TaxID=3156369 RepID=UPI003393EA85